MRKKAGRFVTVFIAVLIILISYHMMDMSFTKSDSPFTPGEIHPDIGPSDSKVISNRAGNEPIIWNDTMEVDENKDFVDTVLKIEAGSVIRVDPGVYINVTGKVVCEGTETSPVYIVGNKTSANWKGMTIHQSELGKSYFNHTFFKLADSALNLKGAMAELRECAFDVNDVGIYSNGSSNIVITNTSFGNCFTHIRLDGKSNIEALNCAISKEKIDFIDEESKFSLKWFLNLKFAGKLDYLKEISVSVASKDETAFDKEIDISEGGGQVRFIPCQEVILKKNRQTIYAFHKITYECMPSLEHSIDLNTRYVYMDSSKTLELPLAYYAQNMSMISRVDKESLKAFTKDILNFPNRWMFSSDHKNVAEYLRTRFTDYFGTDVEYDNFTGNGTEVINVVATQKGLDTLPDKDEYLIVAHYDTESPSFKGVDDDVSGVAVLLECARILSSYEFDATIKYIALDGGANGSGRLGSEHYARNRSEDIGAVISLDRVGYNAGQEDVCGLWTNDNSRSLEDNITYLNSKLDIGLKVRPIEGNMSGQDDYASFWEHGCNATGLSESSEQNVAHWWPEDWPENDDDHTRLDFSYMKKFAQLCSAVIFEYAGVKQYPPTKPVITSSDSTHVLIPTIEWKDSFDFNGDEIDFHISIKNLTNNASIVNDVIIPPTTNYTLIDPLAYGNMYRINVTAYKSNNPSLNSTTTQVLSVDNEAPSFKAWRNETVKQGQMLIIPLEATDTDEPPDTLTYQILKDHTTTINCTNATLNSTTSEFKWKPTNDDVGDNKTITFSVTDGLGGEDFLTVKVSIENENDDPYVNITYINTILGNQSLKKLIVDEDKCAYIDPKKMFIDPDIGIGNESGLDYTSITLNPAFTIDTEDDGTFKLSADDNYFGNGTIEIRAEDNYGGKANQSFTFQIEPVNDPPWINYTENLTTDEGEEIELRLDHSEEDSANFNNKYGDVDDLNTSLSVHITSDNLTFTREGDNSTFVIFRCIPDYFSSGLHYATINVTDDEGNFTVHVINITILDLLASPIPLFKPPSKPEPGKWVTFDASKSYDPDGENYGPMNEENWYKDLTFSWDFGDGETGEGHVVRHKYESTGDYIVTLTVRDTDGKSTNITMVIEVEYPPNIRTVVCSIGIIIAIVIIGGLFLSRVGKKEIDRRMDAKDRKRSKELAKMRKDMKTGERSISSKTGEEE